MPSISFLMLYMFYIVYVVYVDSCVVSQFLLICNRDIASDAIFLLLGIYVISGPYSSSINPHRNGRSVLKLLQDIFIWSVYIFILCLRNIVRNSFTVLTMLSNSFYMTLYRVCGPVSLWLQKVTGLPS